MTDVGFVIAGYGVVLGGLAGYAVLLLRRLAAARADVASRSEVAPETDEDA